jgi:hypothetical protein
MFGFCLAGRRTLVAGNNCRRVNKARKLAIYSAALISDFLRLLLR